MSKLGSRKQPISKSKLKNRSRAAKHQIEKLDANIDELNEIRDSINKEYTEKKDTRKALDTIKLREDLKLDKENKKKKQIIEKDLSNQLDLLNGMNL